ncbi:cell division protein FtsZ [Thermopetrobacter sp. TC1]|uniref:cell division protein FtsZ n=1 Tax=Thermopetrobacter sp. TC1 TaxID=1495045 RepID=UPI00056E0F37|nr:cell division protein FtsZ [Thermopetrobacter sp. TC1]
MSNLKVGIPNLAEMKPRIVVFGVGGGGCNAVNNMIESNLTGVEFVVANTDAQALAKSPCERKIQMGNALTQGLGAGSRPEIGAGAAEEAMAEILDHLAGSHMAFITAGMGGGTGTGAAPVIAKAAKEQGILTVGVVTKPFHFEGRRRMMIAEKGIENLAKNVDTLIVIPNQNLFRVANEKTSFTAAFAMADQVLYSGVASITELMTKEGLINLDFADVRAVMSDMGKAMMGTGEASGEKRAIEAAEAAISNPLLDDVSLTGARGVLISIAGGPDLTLYEVDEAANRIREEVDDEANIIVGATIEDELEGTMRVSVVATGLSDEKTAQMPHEPARSARSSEEVLTGYYPGANLPGGMTMEPQATGTPESAPAPTAPESEALTIPPVREQETAAVQHDTQAAEEAAVRDAEMHAPHHPGQPQTESATEAEQLGISFEQPEEPKAAHGTTSTGGHQEPHIGHGPVKGHTPAPTAPPVPDPAIGAKANEKIDEISEEILAHNPKGRSRLIEMLHNLGFKHLRGSADAAEKGAEARKEPEAKQAHGAATKESGGNVHPLPHVKPAAPGAHTPAAGPAAALDEEDDLEIPTFLRRQQN